MCICWYPHTQHYFILREDGFNTQEIEMPSLITVYPSLAILFMPIVLTFYFISISFRSQKCPDLDANYGHPTLRSLCEMVAFSLLLKLIWTDDNTLTYILFRQMLMDGFILPTISWSGGWGGQLLFSLVDLPSLI